MALYRFKEYYPDYRETFSDSGISDLDSYSLYTRDDHKIGSVHDMLVDGNGYFRYLVIDTGPWIFGKQVLLPIGLSHFDYDQKRVYVDGLTKEQVENLPEYNENLVVDEAYEDRVRNVYRPVASQRTNRQYLQSSTPQGTQASTSAEKSYDYNRDPAFYNMSEQENHQPLRLYEERLVADKQRRKTGEVTLNKRVETNTAQASVPIEKERVIVDRRNADNARPVAPGERPTFQEGEVARVEVYEETANIEKQAFVREEVDVRKVVDRDTVTAEETVRREEIDVDTTGQPNMDRSQDVNRRQDRGTRR